VVDDATERRGLASINAVWKNKVAVLVGDFLLSRGLLVAVEHGETGFLGVTSNTVRRMSEGELLQIQKSRQKTLDEATYFSIISDKTASLLSACCEIGAMSATDDVHVHTRLRRFGESLGQAFQIRDDVLDYTSRTSILGKPVGNDIREGKITLPLLLAQRHADASDAKKIIAIVKKKGASDKDVTHVQDFDAVMARNEVLHVRHILVRCAFLLHDGDDLLRIGRIGVTLSEKQGQRDLPFAYIVAD
ncbi:MAG: polyprenyl synthetase family protein, partial [Candidatus Kapaibacterium sp.]